MKLLHLYYEECVIFIYKKSLKENIIIASIKFYINFVIENYE